MATTTWQALTPGATVTSSVLSQVLNAAGDAQNSAIASAQSATDAQGFANAAAASAVDSSNFANASASSANDALSYAQQAANEIGSIVPIPAGGALNQVLTKASAADYDYKWAAGGGGGGGGSIDGSVSAGFVPVASGPDTIADSILKADANGIELANNKFYRALNVVGDTSYNLAGINTSNAVVLGSVSLASILQASANAYVFIGGTERARFTSSSILPGSTNTIDLGVTGTRFRHLWLAGDATAANFSGGGGSLTGLNASQLTTGTIPGARFPATLPAASGVNLTALNATQLTSGTIPGARFPATLPAASGANLTSLNAGNLSSGTIPDGRFPATLPAASGANLTALNASNLASGTVGTARLGTGTADGTTFLRGDGTWASPPGGGGGSEPSDGDKGDITVTASGMTWTIDAGAITNAMIAPAAGIADSKLATISTAGKVANSATTAASANTASAIVARDASGNFSAGTITATQFSGGGSGLSGLNASSLSSGTVGTARLGSGTADSTTFLRGDGTWQTPSATDATKLPLAGGTMSGDIYMDGHLVVGAELKAYQETRYAHPTTSGALALTYSNGNIQHISLNGNISSVSFSGWPTNGGSMTLILVQDATGSRTINWPSSVLWPGGASPTLSGANKIDIVNLVRIGSYYYATASLGYTV